MTLQSAATFAFIATLLSAALLVWDLLFDVVNVMRGLIPAVTLFSAFIYALAALSLAVFFYLFRKGHN